MGSQICLKQDVLNALRAAYVANRGSARLMAQTLGQFSVHDGSSDAILSAYNSGFAAALAAVGIAFGLDHPDEADAEEPDQRDRKRQELRDDRRPLPRSVPSGVLPTDAELIGFLWIKAGYTDRDA